LHECEASMKSTGLICWCIPLAFAVAQTTAQPVWNGHTRPPRQQVPSTVFGRDRCNGNRPQPNGRGAIQTEASRGSSPAFASDGPSPAWVRHYINPTDPSQNTFNAVAFDRNGNVCAGGSSEEYPAGRVALLCKYDHKGILLWTVREKSSWEIAQLEVDTSGNIYALGYPYLAKFDPQGALQWLIDTCNAQIMALDSAGNVFVTRPNESLAGPYFSETITIKYNPAGIPLWVARISMPGFISYPNDIAVDRTGAVVVTGAGYVYGSSPSGVTIKYSPDGIEEWRATHSTGYGGHLTVDGSGAVYVSGGAENPIGSAHHFTQKFSSDGTPLWLAETSGYASGIGLDYSGNVFVAVYLNGYNTIKYDSSGHQKWVTHLDPPGSYAVPLGFCVDRLGNAYLTSSSHGGGGHQTIIVQYDGNGTARWTHVCSDAGFYSPMKRLAADAIGNVFLAAALGSIAYGRTEALLVTLDTAGIERWRATYEGPKLPVDIPADIGVDSAGNVYVCGTKPLAQGTTMGFFVLKYAPNGDLQWKRTGDTTSFNGDEQKPEINVSPDGSTIVLHGANHGLTDTNRISVALTSFSSGGLEQWSVVAHTPGFTWWRQKNGLLSDVQGNIYAVSALGGVPWDTDSTGATFLQKFSKDGRLLWSRDALGKSPISAALDHAGDLSVLTIASSWFHDGLELPSVLRYDQSGHLDWTAQLDKPEESNLRVVAIATDDSGAVVVTGGVNVSPPGRGYFLTVKLSSTGAHRWIQAYDEGSGFSEMPEEIAIDSNGNVIVAGNTTIVSYSRDGIQRWVVKRPPGSGRTTLQRVQGQDVAIPIAPASITNVVVDKKGSILAGYSGGGMNQDTPGAVKYSNSGSVLWSAFGGVAPTAIALDRRDHLCFAGGYGDIVTVSYDLGVPVMIGSRVSIPGEFVLLQNYPNPFNPSTSIRYGLPERSHVNLVVYNTLGQQVTVLQNGEQEAGYHDVKFDASALPSGVYFYRLHAGSYVETRKLCLVR
jgi:hypothetical protein